MSPAPVSSSDPSDLPTSQKVLGCFSSLVTLAVLIGVGWFFFNTCIQDSEPDLIEVTPTPDLTKQTEEMLSHLEELCPSLISTYAGMTARGYDTDQVVTATANHFNLTPNEASEVLQLCAKWGKAVIEIDGK